MFPRTLLLLIFLPSRIKADRNISVSVPNPAIYFDTTFAADKTPCPTYWTDKIGGAASFTFKGSSIFLYGTSSSYGGRFNIQLDGVQVITVDRYSTSSSISCDQLLWSATGLTYTSHTLHMEFAGKSNSSQGSGYFDVQKLMYTVPDNATVTSDSATVSATGPARGLGDSSSGSPSTGPIIGAVVGALIGAALLGIGIFLWRRRLRKRYRQQSTPAPGDSRNLDIASAPVETSGPLMVLRPYSTEPFIWRDDRQPANHPPQKVRATSPPQPSHPERRSYEFPVVPFERTDGKTEKYRTRRRSEERFRRLSSQTPGTNSSGPTSSGGDTSSVNRESTAGDPSTVWSDPPNSSLGAILSEPDVARIAQAVLVGLQAQGPSGTGAEHSHSSVPPPAYH